MYQKFFIIITALFVSSLANADVTKQSLDITGEKISEYVSNLIPGEGLTETSIKINDATSDEINFSILGVRDISSTDRSNIFTQFSLANEEINSSGRITGNLGFGYRRLSEDENFMFGANTFYDRDLTENQERLGLGLEAKASIVDITLNNCTDNEIDFSVTCSKGTYIRVLGQDIAIKLKTIGYLTKLVRIKVGPYMVDDSTSIKSFEEKWKSIDH